MPDSAFDAIVLVGGAGSRLGGVDKAAVQLAGAPLVSSALESARTASTLVVVGQTRAPLPPNAVQIVEDPPGSGPAAATVAGLRRIDTHAPWTMLLACDLPGAAVAVPRLLACLPAGSQDGAAFVDPDGHPQWLLALYRTSSLLAAADRLGNPVDRSMRALLAGLELRLVEPLGREWHDVDTWADHARWQHDLGEGEET